MTQEDKNLLLKDLCARLPYGVKATDQLHGDSSITDIDVYEGYVYYFDFDEWGKVEDCKPYLRSMSSMTEEENKEFSTIRANVIGTYDSNEFYAILSIDMEDWLNKNMIDYRGLIEKGLALKASEDMYKTE